MLTHSLPVTRFSIVQIENNLLMFIQHQQIPIHYRKSFLNYTLDDFEGDLFDLYTNDTQIVFG